MASFDGKGAFVALVAEEIASGINCALRYWLGRIELEVIDRSLTPHERLQAIEQILAEYKMRELDSIVDNGPAADSRRGDWWWPGNKPS
ncbi:MAG: hypothetical protein JO356_11385 [Acidobacteria bacterium]|nr:hypothetical protein [Acidobacteriota bacterium]